MNLSGPVPSPAEHALSVLRSTLDEGFKRAPFASRFKSAGGVGVTSSAVEAESWVRSRRPYVYLELAHEERNEWGKNVMSRYIPGHQHNLEISAEVITPPASVDVEIAVKEALKAIITDAFDALDDAGLEDSSLVAGQGKNQNPERINPHTISCSVYSLSI